jgi:hypothetical protein
MRTIGLELSVFLKPFLPQSRITSHTIETTLDLKGDEEGVIVACGGHNGGYTLFIADHKLYYEYSFLNTVRYEIVSPEFPSGKVDVKFNFVKTENLKGIEQLYVNGKKVAEGALDQRPRWNSVRDNPRRSKAVVQCVPFRELKRKFRFKTRNCHL